MCVCVEERMKERYLWFMKGENGKDAEERNKEVMSKVWGWAGLA